MKILSAFAICVALAIAGPAQALSDFQGGTIDGWSPLGAGTTAVAMDSGPAGVGDNALLAFADPNDNSLGFGNTTNPVFLGTLQSAGVVSVSFDALGLSTNDDPFEIHVVLIGGGGTIWISNQSAAVAADDTFGNYTISLLEADMTLLAGVGAFATEFDDVIQFSLVHEAGGDPALSSANNIGVFDNIALNVPEPSSLALLSIVGLVAASRRRQA